MNGDRRRNPFEEIPARGDLPGHRDEHRLNGRLHQTELFDHASPATGGGPDSCEDVSQTPDLVRASEFIGETVRNGKGEKIGSVDDLILNRGNKVLYAVISVGGFLGIGDKLVAVPFQDLKFGARDVKGVVIYDTTKEQLKAQPAFAYAEFGHARSRTIATCARPSAKWTSGKIASARAWRMRKATPRR